MTSINEYKGANMRIRRCGSGFELTVAEGAVAESIVLRADEAETIMSAIKERRRAAVSNAARFGDSVDGSFEGLCALAGDGLVSTEPPPCPEIDSLWVTLTISGLPRTEVQLSRGEAEELHRRYLSLR